MSEENKGDASRSHLKTSSLDKSNFVPRYAKDFEEIGEIGRGGFGFVCKARHRLDKNIYAIKKIKLSDKPDENKRILREISHLSSLNNQHIVRYFQTWIECEEDPVIMDKFAEWLEDDSEDEENETNDNEDDSFEMKTE